MNLTGEERRQLQEALLSAFPSHAELEQMLSFQLDENLNALAMGDSLSDVAFKLLQWAEARGRVDELITKAHSANPGNQELRVVAELIGQQRIGNVSSIASSPQLIAKVSDILIVFRADFEAASGQIEVLSNYKDLHDLLHELQIHCYDRLIQEAKRFPDDETAHDNLSEHNLTLKQLIDLLQNVLRRGTFSQNDTSWIEYLVEAQSLLATALSTSDADPLNRSISLIRRVLQARPSEINICLNAAARALRLSELVKALSAAREKLMALPEDEAQIQEFVNGVDALTSLDHKLTVLTRDHNRWQGIDIELRQTEEDLGQHIENLKLYWKSVNAMVNSLLTGNTEEWAKSLQADTEKLNRAIADQDVVRIKRQFRLVRRQAIDRFYRVDLNLKELCDELRKVGQPLAAVTRLM